MARSAAFARITSEVLELTAAVPAGRVTTYASIAAHLNVMPRHVAYILATLSDAERDVVPWHRVTADNGLIRSSARRWALEQRARLKPEGVDSDDAGVADFAAHFVAASSLVMVGPR